MKIAVLCFHTLGGSGVVASELGRELSLRGHELHFIGAGLPSRLEARSERVFFHEVPLEEAPPVLGEAFPLLLAAKLVDVAKEHGIDVIHAHYALPHAAAALLARESLSKKPPLVLSLHGSDVPESAPHGLLQLLQRLVREAAAVTVPSAALAARAREQLLCEPAVFPNFVDVERFSPGPPRPLKRTLFHASNFRPVKRPQDLLRIFAKVRERMPATLVLAGDGPLRPGLMTEARERGLSGVRFAGAVPDLLPLLRESDLFLLPSAKESFGLAALEALACGVPVVGSRTGGIPDVVGEAGALFEPGDVDGMAEAAVRILGNPAEHARLRTLARDRAVRYFAKAPLLDRWEALYRSVTSGRAFEEKT
ncbi:MAG TPA: N-acetyl-alpha-D-glucosaminyl L-malate synthase BshA [Myxococcales bacterium]|jgi:N-acetyl-alpha-D-glucosaminyl L-malate synthase BshA